MSTSRCPEGKMSNWKDMFVDIVRNPYAEEDDNGNIIPKKHPLPATKDEFELAVLQVISCLGAIVFGGIALFCQTEYTLLFAILGVLCIIINGGAEKELHDAYNEKLNKIKR